MGSLSVFMGWRRRELGEFKLISDYTPGGDQPAAIDKLTKGITEGKKYQTLLGATGTGKTFSIAHVIQKVQRPRW
jgi:excinuclease ABC subunit B